MCTGDCACVHRKGSLLNESAKVGDGEDERGIDFEHDAFGPDLD